jgi:hypothetical protein
MTALLLVTPPFPLAHRNGPGALWAAGQGVRESRR